ncbi:MAG: hypothetical protein AB9835_05585 [Eubacteriales bacterium]
MKSAFEILKYDKELNYLLDNANYNMNHTQNFERETSGINYTICCHGKHHTMYVVGAIEYILSALSYDEHTIELGKIAGLLHDIGNFFGRNDHATMSASMCLYFISKTNLNLNDLNIIKQAVLDHSKGVEIQSAVGAALIIADKMTDRKRSIHLKEDMIRCGFDNEAELNKNDKLLGFSYTYNIKDIQFNIIDRDLIFDFIVEGDIELFMSEYFIKKLKSMPVMLTKKAAAFLNCGCIYEINGDEIEI